MIMVEREQDKTTLLGVRAVADACKVADSTVYGWLRRRRDMPQPRFEIAGPLTESGERKKTPAWSADQLPAILDWYQHWKG